MPINNYVSNNDPYGNVAPTGALAGMLFPQRMRDYYARRDLQNQGMQVSNDFELAKLGTYNADAPLRDVTRSKDIQSTKNQMELMPGQHQLAMGNLETDIKAMPHLNAEKLYQAVQKLPRAKQAQAIEQILKAASFARAHPKLETDEDADLLIDLMEHGGMDVGRWRRQPPPQAPQAPMGPQPSVDPTSGAQVFPFQPEALPEGTPLDDGVIDAPELNQTQETDTGGIPGQEITAGRGIPGVDKGYGGVDSSSNRRLQELQLLARLDPEFLKHLWDMDKTRYINDEQMSRLEVDNASQEKIAGIAANTPAKKTAKDLQKDDVMNIYAKVLEASNKKGSDLTPAELSQILTPVEQAKFFDYVTGKKTELEEKKAQLRAQQGAGSLNVLTGQPSGVEAGTTTPGYTDEKPGFKVGQRVQIGGKNYTVSRIENGRIFVKGPDGKEREVGQR